MAEKSLWHNGFLTLENEVIQRYHSSQAALIALQKKPLFLCCKGMSKCNVLGEKTVVAQQPLGQFLTLECYTITPSKIQLLCVTGTHNRGEESPTICSITSRWFPRTNTVSMLSAMLECGTGNYLDLLAPFVLNSLPNAIDSAISIDAVTEAMREFGFKDFPHKTTEKILDRLCKTTENTVAYVRCTSVNKKRIYRVAAIYNNTDFNSSKYEMRKKIDGILKAMQEYFKTHFYFDTLKLDELREKLISFFEQNGLTVIQSVGDIYCVHNDCNGVVSLDYGVYIDMKNENALYTLLMLIKQKGLKNSAVYKKANISKQHFSKLINDPDAKPSKPTAIALALALELDLDATRDLIGRAGYALTNSSTFDLIIRYFIEHKRFNVIEINIALYEFDQSLLGA